MLTVLATHQNLDNDALVPYQERTRQYLIFSTIKRIPIATFIDYRDAITCSSDFRFPKVDFDFSKVN